MLGEEAEGEKGNKDGRKSIFLVAQTVKTLHAMWETWVRSVGWEDPGGGHSNPLQYSCLEKSPWTEEPGGLESTGLQRVLDD